MEHIRQAQVAESLPQNSNKLFSHFGILIKRLKLASLLVAGITADGGNVDHAITELDEGAPLDRNIQVRNVVQDEVGKLLVLVLANPLDEAAGLQRLALLEGRQPVLREAEVEERGDRDTGGFAKLFLLLD